MTDACIIAGALVDAKNVGVHKSLRLIIDVPQEQAMDVIAKLGWPTMAAPIPVAIARLDPNATKEVMPDKSQHEPQPDTTPASVPTPQARAPNRLAMRAGILCNDPGFWRYLEEIHRTPFWEVITENAKRDLAARFVRQKCGVQSRADILPNTQAATVLDWLETDFTLWRDADKFLETA